MTERLYETQPALDGCRAQVLSCEQGDQGWLVELDRTVLFPGGGGQLCDRGTIDGAEVLSVFEKDGRLFHVCGREFPVGETVNVELDRPLRLYHSQQHTGEHILSGLNGNRLCYYVQAGLCHIEILVKASGIMNRAKLIFIIPRYLIYL